jgi:hypothetical protein
MAKIVHNGPQMRLSPFESKTHQDSEFCHFLSCLFSTTNQVHPPDFGFSGPAGGKSEQFDRPTLPPRGYDI